MDRRPLWWKEAIIYQVYPRSFFDSNGDGFGDLAGVTAKLDKIAELGVDAIWLNPFFKSPNDDGGYDISDYLDIQPEFGTMADFDRLLGEAHKRNLKVIIDLVFNHSSDEHEWFRKSRESKDNPFREFYFWRPGKADGPPSNWPSFFGGSAWELDVESGEYFLHLFSRKQPDLNWENPELRSKLKEIIRYWTDKGVDGIRLDVISAVSKRTDFPDVDTKDFNRIIERYYSNGPRLQEYISELRHDVFQDRSILTIGEGPGINTGNAMNYLDSRNGLDMIFHFGHMFLDQGPGGRFDPVPWSVDEFKQIFCRWDEALNPNGWGSIFLGNHDFARQVSRWGNDGPYWRESAKALLTLLLTLRGTPFIFAGDEIGMTNVQLDAVDESRDVETINGFKVARESGMTEAEFLVRANQSGRDNARTPYQWNDGPNAGFTPGVPWMKINPNASAINRQAQESDPSSILTYFKQLVRLRKTNPTLVYGDFQLLDTGDRLVMAYDRRLGNDWIRIIINLSAEQQPVADLISEMDCILSNVTASNGSMDALIGWGVLVLCSSERAEV